MHVIKATLVCKANGVGRSRHPMSEFIEDKQGRKWTRRRRDIYMLHIVKSNLDANAASNRMLEGVRCPFQASVCVIDSYMLRMK